MLRIGSGTRAAKQTAEPLPPLALPGAVRFDSHNGRRVAAKDKGMMMRSAHRDIEMELGLARNMFGHLSDDIKARLHAYDMLPSLAHWRDVAGLIVGGDRFTTVWQAWIATDPKAAKRGPTTDADGRIEKDWSHWPTRDQFRAAMRYATH